MYLPLRSTRGLLTGRGYPTTGSPNRFRPTDPPERNPAGRMVVLDADGAHDPPSRGLRPRSRARRRACRAGALGSSRAVPDLPGAAGAHVRAAPARVLHAGLQLRRDVPRHPGARAQGRRPALRGGDRPQAAHRALRVRGHVRVLRDQRAVVGAHRRDAGGRAHRAAPRDRGPAPLRRACRMDRRNPVRRRDGVLRATGRPGRELRSVHAPVDDRGDSVRATWARLPRGRRDRGSNPGQADGRGDAPPGALPHRAVTREEGCRRGRARVSPSPPRWSRSRWDRRSSSTGPCSATARTSA